MKENIKKALKYGILGLFFGIISLGVHLYSSIKEDQHYEENYVFKIFRDNLELDYYGAKDTLVDAIDAYIKEIAPASVMNGLAFVNNCDEYNMDLFFVVAQAQVESSFATTGLGHKMNSAFNVKAYDGKGSKHMDKHSHPDESIEPYIKLLKTDYLYDVSTGETKTEMDLMNNYVNFEGKRYATNPDYERMMLSTYKKLTDRYGNLYDEYLKFKTLCGK
jgi:flagellum-specific peptidoglycan hydrolase FlgJ